VIAPTLDYAYNKEQHCRMLCATGSRIYKLNSNDSTIL